MKILLINPNTSAAMTDTMSEIAASVLAPDVCLHAVTAKAGMPYISSRAEAQIAGTLVLEMIAEHGDGCDAVIIGAFGDPGLVAARELFDVPICAMAESAMLTALLLGKTFAFITFSRTLVAWYEDAVALAGLSDRCVGIFVPDMPFASVATVREDLEGAIAELARRVATAHDADVIILAGAPLAGLAERIADQVPVPLVDPLGAAIGHAQALVRLKVRAAKVGRFARPPAKAAHGVPVALADRLEHRDAISGEGA
ncbi:MAG: aspartate/glutamate racemase family protein [Devosia sp.]